MHALELHAVSKCFQKQKKRFLAVDQVSFAINAGECFGLVGESGCGKSTIARMITRLEPVSSGDVLINGSNLCAFQGKRSRDLYRQVQMVFQNPLDSFNPRIILGNSISEILINFGISRKEAYARMLQLLSQVGLEAEFAERYPHQVSGGQCQRAAIARAIAIEPSLLICDEATSALDVSVQAQIVELLARLQQELHMACLFISHDLALVRSICARVAVMRHGRIVEQGDTQQVIDYPQEAYTKQLINSVFTVQ